MSIYKATVTKDFCVVVKIDDIEVDRPGPWPNAEQAKEWADAILEDLKNGVEHYPTPTPSE